jgi:hypothetical protein
MAPGTGDSIRGSGTQVSLFRFQVPLWVKTGAAVSRKTLLVSDF